MSPVNKVFVPVCLSNLNLVAFRVIASFSLMGLSAQVSNRLISLWIVTWTSFSHHLHIMFCFCFGLHMHFSHYQNRTGLLSEQYDSRTFPWCLKFYMFEQMNVAPSGIWNCTQGWSSCVGWQFSSWSLDWLLFFLMSSQTQTVCLRCNLKCIYRYLISKCCYLTNHKRLMLWRHHLGVPKLF